MTPSPPTFTCPVVVGRERELGLLRGWLKDGQNSIVVLGGEAGIGKTRLVRETVAHAQDLGHRVLQAGCFENDRSEPYAPLIDLLRANIGAASPDGATDPAGADTSTLAWLLPELADSASKSPSERPGRRRIFEAAAGVLRGVAAHALTLIVIEDLHWSDEGSLDFLAFLAHHTPLPSRLLLTYRPDDADPVLTHLLAGLDRERSVVELNLARLGPRDVEAMLHAILGRGPVPAEALHLVATLTDGNPFFVEELLKTLGAASAAAGTGQVDLTAIDRLRVPRSVQDAVARRTVHLSPIARRVLDLAAVAGRRFDFPLLQELAAISDVELLTAFKELVAAQLVIEEFADHFAFRHALTRRAVYAVLLTRERRELHRTIAEAITRTHADHLDDYVTELSDHWFEAGIWDEAAAQARHAGERAQVLDAPAVAVYHFSQALAAAQHLATPPLAALYRKRGQAFETLGEFDRALADYEQARDLAHAAGDRAGENTALLDLGLLWAGSDYARMGIYVNQALAVARELSDPTLIARSLNRVGNWLLNIEQPERAQAHHREALAIFQGQDDRQGIAETLDLLGMASFLGADMISGTVYFEQAAALWRELDNRRGLASCLIMLGVRGPNFHGSTVPATASLAEAERASEEGLKIARSIGWRAGEAWALWGLGGLCFAAQGDYGRALEMTWAGYVLAAEIEHRQWTVGADCMLGNIYAELLAWPLARQHLERALSVAREIGSPYWIRSAAAWLAGIAIAQGEPAAGTAILAQELGPKISIRTMAGRLVWAARAELALAQGEPAHALDLIDGLVGSAPSTPDGRPSARLAKLRGEALTALGRISEAERDLLAAQAEATARGWRPMLWRIDLALGRLLLTQRRQEEGNRAFAAARQLIEELAASIPEDPLRATFLDGTGALFPPQPSPRRAAKMAAGGLTERELAVAQFLARGCSNREIATALFLSEWTVATHVRNILAKLNLHSRAQIGAWILGRGLGDRS